MTGIEWALAAASISGLLCFYLGMWAQRRQDRASRSHVT